MKLTINNLSKTYPGGTKAIDRITMELGAGMFGLLGPNGAGKSSLMRTLATLQFPDTGQVLFDQEDIFLNKINYRRKLGYLPQEFGVYPKETASSLLNYFALLKGIVSKKQRSVLVDHVLEVTNLSEVKKKYVSTFSGGMRQRFGIAQLLLNAPELVIVDEPTAGLDPAERTRFLNVIRNIGSENTVLFSTHLVEDVNELCREMGVMHQGQLLTKTSPKLAVGELKGKIWETQLTDEQLNSLSNTIVKLSDRFNSENQLVNRIFAEKKYSETLVPVDAKLEDFYFLTIKSA